MDEGAKPDHRNTRAVDEPAVLPVRKPSPLPDPQTQQEIQRRFLDEMEKLPVQKPGDGFSGRDHDAILYGRRG